MSYEVFETTPEGSDALADDDLVSRQTLVTRNGDEWDVDGKVVLVEGNEEAIEKARSIVEEHGGQASENAEEIKADIDAEQDSAAEGIGNIFG
jgi:hypothetical protein